MQQSDKTRANSGGGGLGGTDRLKDGRDHRRTCKVLRFRSGQRPLPRALGELIRWQRSRLHRLGDSVLPLEVLAMWMRVAGRWLVAMAWFGHWLGTGHLNADVTNCSFHKLKILLSESCDGGAPVAFVPERSKGVDLRSTVRNCTREFEPRRTHFFFLFYSHISLLLAMGYS